MNSKLDWNDYEIVLRIAEEGSLSKAARRIGSSHPTLFRKVNAIETRLGVRLFDRFRSGYRPTVEGEEVVATARKIQELATDTERRVAGRDLRPSGVVRLATTDSLYFGLLAPKIARLRRLQPDITLEVLLSNVISDLSFREADIAIRPTVTPDEHLVGKRLGGIRQAVYAPRSLEFDDQKPVSLPQLPWVGPSLSMPYAQLHSWMRQQDLDRACTCRVDSVLALYQAVRSGIGCAVLPCYLASGDDSLRQVGNEIEALTVDLWLLTHADLRHTARVRAVLEFFGDRNELLSQTNVSA